MLNNGAPIRGFEKKMNCVTINDIFYITFGKSLQTIIYIIYIAIMSSTICQESILEA